MNQAFDIIWYIHGDCSKLLVPPHRKSDIHILVQDNSLDKKSVTPDIDADWSVDNHTESNDVPGAIVWSALKTVTYSL